MKTFSTFVEPGQGDLLNVLSPGIGKYTNPPLPGSLVSTNSPVGVLRVLYREHRLVIPEGVKGYVINVQLKDPVSSVQYRQLLFQLNKLSETSSHESTLGKESGEKHDGMAEGIPIKAPTDGTFYRRPQPDLPPYVEEGTEVSKGDVLGLIEVMKCFFQITCDGPDIPCKAKIARICAKDASPIKVGDVLFYVCK